MAQKISTEEELEVLLVSLGSEPDEVAQALRAAGIYGYRDEPASCPVANWLAQETGLSPHVDRAAVELYPIPIGDEGPLVESATPLAVAEFVGRFDNGEYSDLLEPGLAQFD
jgi:hypothetical protein